MEIATLLPLLLIVGVFWLLILRPARNRQKAQQQLVSSIRPGQKIMTTAGLLGTVTDVTDDEFGLEIAPGVVVRYVKGAVGRVIPDEVPETADASSTDADSDDAGATDADPADAGQPTDGPDADGRRADGAAA